MMEAMSSNQARFLSLVVALGLAACAPALPPVAPASPAEARLSVFVDPEVSSSRVADEQGREAVALFHDALEGAFKDAGYHVVASGPRDLSVHVSVGTIGYNYGPWADKVRLDVFAGAKPIAAVSRPTLNFMSMEGHTTDARIAFAAHTCVNEITAMPEVEQVAAATPAR
jgi:hypothetical protein